MPLETPQRILEILDACEDTGNVPDQADDQQGEATTRALARLVPAETTMPDSYTSFVIAFSVFAAYTKGRDHVAAEHDELFAGPDPAVVSDADLIKLEKHGWTARPDLGCFRKGL